MAKNITIEPLKETTLRVELIGDTDLILHKRSRYYEQAECFKQSKDKASKCQLFTISQRMFGRA